MANDSITAPTPSPSQWEAWRNAQNAAKKFFQAPLGPTGKALVQTFQKSFNAGTECLAIIIRARGGDPSKSFATIPGGLPINVDGLYGQVTCYSLALMVMFSFPASVSKTAAAELLAAPFTRAHVDTWAKKWAPQVNTMVAQTYSDIVSANPSNTQAQAGAAVTQTTNTQASTQQQVDSGKSNTIEVPTSSSTSQPTTPAIDKSAGNQVVQVLDNGDVITATPPKSYVWLWWLLGLSASSAGLLYVFRKKGKRR